MQAVLIKFTSHETCKQGRGSWAGLLEINKALQLTVEKI